MDRLTIHEYNLLIKAANLRQVDEAYTAHMIGWASARARDKKRHGKNGYKPAYKSFDDFFDYREAIDNILHPDNEYKTKMAGLAKLLQKQKGDQDG